MQRLSYPTETVLSDNITRNRIVLSFIQRQPQKTIRTLSLPSLSKIDLATFYILGSASSSHPPSSPPNLVPPTFVFAPPPALHCTLWPIFSPTNSPLSSFSPSISYFRAFYGPSIFRFLICSPACLNLSRRRCRPRHAL